MIISKNILDEVISNIESSKVNYQKFVLIITTNFKCAVECDHMIDTRDVDAIDSISDAIIQYCVQHYTLDYTAQYIDKNTKRIEFCIHKDVDPEAFVRHGYWSQEKTGDGMFDYYFICSECHKNTPDNGFVISPNYCPWCGAKMDLKEK